MEFLKRLKAKMMVEFKRSKTGKRRRLGRRINIF